jgi:hypothetical protein
LNLVFDPVDIQYFGLVQTVRNLCFKKQGLQTMTTRLIFERDDKFICHIQYFLMSRPVRCKGVGGVPIRGEGSDPTQHFVFFGPNQSSTTNTNNESTWSRQRGEQITIKVRRTDPKIGWVMPVCDTKKRVQNDTFFWTDRKNHASMMFANSDFFCRHRQRPVSGGRLKVLYTCQFNNFCRLTDCTPIGCSDDMGSAELQGNKFILSLECVYNSSAVMFSWCLIRRRWYYHYVINL